MGGIGATPSRSAAADRDRLLQGGMPVPQNCGSGFIYLTTTISLRPPRRADLCALPGGRQALREEKRKKEWLAKTQRRKGLRKSNQEDHYFFASWRLCANKKEKIRRGGLFWKRISYHNELSLISCLLAL